MGRLRLLLLPKIAAAPLPVNNPSFISTKWPQADLFICTKLLLASPHPPNRLCAPHKAHRSFFPSLQAVFPSPQMVHKKIIFPCAPFHNTYFFLLFNRCFYYTFLRTTGNLSNFSFSPDRRPPSPFRKTPHALSINPPSPNNFDILLHPKRERAGRNPPGPLSLMACLLSFQSPRRGHPISLDTPSEQKGRKVTKNRSPRIHGERPPGLPACQGRRVPCARQTPPPTKR